jgi:hypothetical protein
LQQRAAYSCPSLRPPQVSEGGDDCSHP